MYLVHYLMSRRINKYLVVIFELSFKSTGPLVESWLFCIQHLSVIGKVLWCMFEALNEAQFFIGSLRVKFIMACQEVLK
jgi:hypothetical protein